MKLFIKNMVCSRCISAVENIFSEAGISFSAVTLGEIETEKGLSANELQQLDRLLQQSGFKRLEDRAKQEIGKVKKAIITKIDTLDISEDFILSNFVSENLHKDYSSISKNFSQHENVTLEQYFILQKIEKVKELLSYDEFSLTEISVKLGYRSVQHLSSQFKTITGFTPSVFKKLKEKNRIALDKVEIL